MKIVITDVYDLKYNFGVQGLVLPLIEKIRKYTDDASFILPVQTAYLNQPNIEFAREKGINLIGYWKYSFIIDLFYPLIRLINIFSFSSIPGKASKSKPGPLSLYRELAGTIKSADMVIDVAGIEFIGNNKYKYKWGELFFTRMFQKMAGRFGVSYFKYTKSYGPLEGFLFRWMAKKLLAELPFLFIRGSNNLEEMKKFDLKTPMYLFPDVSLILKPSPKEKAMSYLKSLGVDIDQPLVGISPSRVLSKIAVTNPENTVGNNHRELVKKFIREYLALGYQVLIIPHAMDRIDRKKCDWKLSLEILNEIGNPENVCLTGEDLSYADTRAVIGLLSFYVTGRYHSVASALYMGVPVICLAWHIKYIDIMSEFLDDFLAVDCRNTGINDAWLLIRKYHEDMSWFDRQKIRSNRLRIERQVERSIKMIMEYAHVARLESSFDN